jgi:hypothetical protein
MGRTALPWIVSQRSYKKSPLINLTQKPLCLWLKSFGFLAFFNLFLEANWYNPCFGNLGNAEWIPHKKANWKKQRITNV